MIVQKPKFWIVVVFVFSFIGVNKIFCQDSLNTSYASAMLYILHEQEVVDKVRSVFPRMVKKRQKCLELTASTRMEYCPIYNFFSNYIKGSLLDSITGREDTVTPKEFDRMNRFEAFDLPYLAQLIPRMDTELIVRFSRLNNRYVLAEVLDRRMNFGKYRHGKSVQILLFYGEEPTVQSCYMTARVYN